MGKRKLVEAAEASDRARQRQNLGTLRELTVQPATKKRYKAAVDRFLAFLRQEQLTLPTNRHEMDPLVCDYLEHLWSTGSGRALASDTVAGIQDLQPNLRHQLSGAWRLLKTWAHNEIPSRAPPLPEHLVHAMAGWAFFKGYFSFGASLLFLHHDAIWRDHRHQRVSSHGVQAGQTDFGIPWFNQRGQTPRGC